MHTVNDIHIDTFWFMLAQGAYWEAALFRVSDGPWIFTTLVRTYDDDEVSTGEDLGPQRMEQERVINTWPTVDVTTAREHCDKAASDVCDAFGSAEARAQLDSSSARIAPKLKRITIEGNAGVLLTELEKDYSAKTALAKRDAIMDTLAKIATRAAKART